MLRCAEQRARRPVLDDDAPVHDEGPVADVAHDREVVADEHQGDGGLPADVGQRVEHLRLDRHVERGDRLVEDEDTRLDRERPGDRDALALSSGQPALGSALGADPTAVYRHFRDKDELVGALFDRLLVGVLAAREEGGDWRTQLLDLATRTWDACVDHPTVGAAAQSLTTGGPGELGAIETILHQFMRAGLDEREAVRFYALYSSYVLSVGGSMATYRLTTATSTVRGTPWLGDLGPVFPARYPATAAARADLAALQDRDVFMTGLEVVLDAAAATGRRERA